MAQTNMQLTDWLDDLSVRFIVNLPLEELESMERICFQIEEAQWFYEDFIRPLDPNLPSLNLRQFSMKIFQHSPLFSVHEEELHAKAFSEFLAYKTRVPVRGAILLNEAMDQVLLVKGWKKGASWSFPRGKINKGEEDLDCAIREVYEETGFDANTAGLVGDREEVKSIDITMREQHMKLFVFPGISMNTHFEPRTRKEISAINWYRLSDLPTLKKVKNQQDGGNTSGVNSSKFYMVAPFVRPLKRIISQLRKERAYTTAAPAMLEPLDTVSLTLPEYGVMPNTLHTGNDMNRLMAQLRQSSQASREANYPEVSELQDAQRAASVRENKATAMLSLLRSGQSGQVPYSMSQLAPQTPLDQITGQPTQPPRSPRSHTIQAHQHSDRPVPPIFEVSPEQASQSYVGQPVHPQAHQPRTRHLNPSVLEQQNLLPSFLRESNQPYQSKPTSAPYHNTDDPSFVQTPGALASKHAAPVPPASRLPAPKLTTHSSTLLNLFRSGQPPPINTMPTSASLIPAIEPTRPELSLSSISNVPRLQQAPLVNITSPAMLSSTPALVSPTSAGHASDLKRSSQQETLLNLFRQPKPSPSLAPPLDPVELSAQGSPTHSRMSSDYLLRREKPAARSSAKVEMWAPRGLELASSDGKVSATISGPLNVPQFEKILKRPATLKTQPTAPVQTVPEMPKTQQPMKILSRPGTSHKPTNEPAAMPQRSPQPKKSSPPKHKSKASSKELPFQPTILKRPETARQQAEQTSQHETVVEDDNFKAPSQQFSAPPGTLPAAPVQVTPIIDRRSSQTQNQKAALLSLFGKPSAATSPSPAAGPASVAAPAPTSAHGRRGSVVSPLSEKPPVGSTLPSPLGISKSRMPSLQSERAVPTRTKSSETTQTTTSPVDKKFLLGYLDSVASQGHP